MGLCLTKKSNDGDGSDDNVEFAGGNVHLITTKESWDQKLQEAKRDGKIKINMFVFSLPEVVVLYIMLTNKHALAKQRPFLSVEVHQVSCQWLRMKGKEDSPTLWRVLHLRLFFYCKKGEVIANFSASWCGPCRIIAPFYVDLSVKHPEMMFLTIDVDELTEFSTSWEIKATPTFFFLKDGQQLDKLVGANKPELEKKLTSILDSEASRAEPVIS